MFAAQIMVPCFEWSCQCRLDWTAIAAVGGWAAATATFAAVYVPARNYRRDNERRERRERLVSMIDINKLIPKVLDIKGQVKAIKTTLPSVRVIFSKDATVQTVASILRIKGNVPFSVLSDGLEGISIATTNLQSALDVVDAFLGDGLEIEKYENHPFTNLENYEVSLDNVERAVDNTLLAISKFAGIDTARFEVGADG